MLSRGDGLLQPSEEREGKWRAVCWARPVSPHPRCCSGLSCGLEMGLFSLCSEFVLVLCLAAALAQPDDSSRQVVGAWSVLWHVEQPSFGRRTVAQGLRLHPWTMARVSDHGLQLSIRSVTFRF